MKKLFLKVLGICAMLVTVSGMKAQKTAHLDMDSILTVMPEFKAAMERSEAKRQELAKYINSMQQKLEATAADAEQRWSTMSTAEQQDVQAEVADLQKRIQNRQQSADQEYQAYNASLQKPIYEKLNKAIEAVAKESGYKYVLSKVEGMVLYADPADDIFNLVKKKLDSMPPAKLPEETVKPGAGTGTPGGTGTGTGTGTKPGGAGAGGTGTGVKPKPAGGGK